MKYFYLAFILVLLSFCAKDLPLNQLANQPCITYHAKHDTIVLLVMGQSNAANAGSELFSSPCINTFNFYQGKYYPLKDPLLGANGNGGSVWSRLGYMLIENNFANVVIVAPVAVGGTTIEQWISGGDLNYLIGETIGHLNAANLTVTHVLWHQGESNNSILYPNSTPAQNAMTYASNFRLLVDHLRNLGIQSPIFPAVATRCADLTPDVYLQQAQQNLAVDSLGVFNGPNTDILGLEYRYDECHFNGEGLDVHAILWLNSLLQY